MDSVNLLDYLTDDYEIRQDLFPPSPWQRGMWKLVDGSFVLNDAAQAKANADRKAEIILTLEKIDAKSIRSIREGDAARIAEWETQAEMLRAELATL
jgi:hypothetical protein